MNFSMIVVNVFILLRNFLRRIKLLQSCYYVLNKMESTEQFILTYKIKGSVTFPH